VGRVSVHAVRVELEHERRDHARVPDLRFLARHVRRSRAARSSRWRVAKFGALLLVPLWAGYPEARRSLERPYLQVVSWSRPAAAFSILLLEPSPAHAARVFWDRTFGWQVGRDSPFSIWGWGQYHAAGIPDLGPFQQLAIVLLVAGAIACYFVPRRKTPLQLAALTARS
jgi:hypothetical protein